MCVCARTSGVSMCLSVCVLVCVRVYLRECFCVCVCARSVRVLVRFVLCVPVAAGAFVRACVCARVFGFIQICIHCADPVPVGRGGVPHPPLFFAFTKAPCASSAATNTACSFSAA